MTAQFKVPMSRPDIGRDEIEAILSVFDNGWVSQGKVTEEFEAQLSRYLSSNVIAVNNGSSALMCALVAQGLKPKDKVIVPAFTFVATSSVPKLLGAQVIVADIDPFTLNISPESLEQTLKENPDVKMVITVDVAGMPADIDAFVELSKRYHFTLIEDAAEAFGAQYKNKMLGSYDHTTIFSFQIAKQITTIEGGCIATLDEHALRRMNKIKDYGRTSIERYVHDVVGANFRTTDLQSAMGMAQLKKADKYIYDRNWIARQYSEKITLEFQSIPTYVTRHSYMLFFALAKDKESRDRYLERLNAVGIDARKCWTPIHMQPCNPELQNLKCDNAERVFDRALTLPIYNSMSSDEVRAVIEACSVK
ncbi:MAG TPA: DegT/DnrJ/EryC1/StrS family aminotransferase [Nitrososphaera sp.]|nr:DegT/DnrJ/EryC1/StrS family aminotransferase [Nitrososphaera sp.]